MGFWDKLKAKVTDYANITNQNGALVVKTNKSTKEEPSKFDLLSSEDRQLYFEFDDKHYDAAQRWYDKYIEIVEDNTSEFYEIFDYKKRISILEKVIKAYDNFFKNFSKYGRGGEIFFELEFSDLNKEYTPTSFRKEYPFDTENVNCYKWLLQYYIEHQEEVCKIINDEYIESEYGSYEAYEEAVPYEKHIKELNTKIVTLIKKNDGILQKDIYKEFNPDDVDYVKSYLKELACASNIERVKSGSTYSLHYVKPSSK